MLNCNPALEIENLLEQYEEVIELSPNLYKRNLEKSKNVQQIISFLNSMKKDTIFKLILLLNEKGEISISSFLEENKLNPQETIRIISSLSNDGLIQLSAKRESSLNIYICLSDNTKNLLNKLGGDTKNIEEKQKIIKSKIRNFII